MSFRVLCFNLTSTVQTAVFMCEWQCLNRLRTRVGRCKYNMNKWGYCDDDTTCDCTEEPQTMEHLLNCPLLPQACTTDDLLIYNDTAQRCVKQWMTKV